MIGGTIVIEDTVINFKFNDSNYNVTMNLFNGKTGEEKSILVTQAHFASIMFYALHPHNSNSAGDALIDSDTDISHMLEFMGVSNELLGIMP